jgi:hypothetical protein
MRYQIDDSAGTAILANNSSSTTELLTIENCSDFDGNGIIVAGNYTDTTKANHVNAVAQQPSSLESFQSGPAL